MAPRAPTGRTAVLAWLRSPNAGRTPAWLPLGNPATSAGVVHEDGVWRVRRTQTDAEGFNAFMRELQASGRPLYPEHVERFARPTGEVFIEATTLDEFIARIESYDWPTTGSSEGGLTAPRGSRRPAAGASASRWPRSRSRSRR